MSKYSESNFATLIKIQRVSGGGIELAGSDDALHKPGGTGWSLYKIISIICKSYLDGGHVIYC